MKAGPKKKFWGSLTCKILAFVLTGVSIYLVTFSVSVSYLHGLEHKNLPVHVASSLRRRETGNDERGDPENPYECVPPPWTIENSVPQLSMGCDDIAEMHSSGHWFKIGEGYWRDVFLVEWEGGPAVVKYMKETHNENSRNLDRHCREIIALGLLSESAHMVPLVGHCGYHVATAWMPLDLEDVVLKHSQPIPYGRVLRIALDATRGVRDLHEVPGGPGGGGPVAHADLQPRQFLVDWAGRVRVNDFNRCRFVAHTKDGEACPFRISSSNGKWRSPEEYTKDADLTEKLDVYSLALVLWSLLSREEPFGDRSGDEQKRFVRDEGGRPPVDPAWPEPFTALLREMWAQAPEDRPSAKVAAEKLEKILQEYEKEHPGDDGYRFDYTKGEQQLAQAGLGHVVPREGPYPPGNFQVGDKVEARYGGQFSYHPATVTRARADGTLDLAYAPPAPGGAPAAAAAAAGGEAVETGVAPRLVRPALAPEDPALGFALRRPPAAAAAAGGDHHGHGHGLPQLDNAALSAARARAAHPPGAEEEPAAAAAAAAGGGGGGGGGGERERERERAAAAAAALRQLADEVYALAGQEDGPQERQLEARLRAELDREVAVAVRGAAVEASSRDTGNQKAGDPAVAGAAAEGPVVVAVAVANKEARNPAAEEEKLLCKGPDWEFEEPKNQLAGCERLGKPDLLEGATLLGAGRSYRAYAALWADLQRDVAITVLAPGADPDEHLPRLEREAALLARPSLAAHPRLAAHWGRCGAAAAREPLPLTAGAAARAGALPYQIALRLVLGMAEALRALHQLEGGFPASLNGEFDLDSFGVDYDGTVKLLGLTRARLLGQGKNGRACVAGESLEPPAIDPREADVRALGRAVSSLLGSSPGLADAAGAAPLANLGRHWEAGRHGGEKDPNVAADVAVKAVLRLLSVAEDTDTEGLRAQQRYRIPFPEWTEEEHAVAKKAAEEGQRKLKEQEQYCHEEAWFSEYKYASPLSCDDMAHLKKTGTLLGEGYWRNVYAATTDQGKHLVVKYMKDSHSLSQKNLARHEREAAVLGRLKGHPQVVQFAGRCDYHLATEWLPLGLDAVLYNHRGGHPHIPLYWKLRIARDVAAGLAALHGIGRSPADPDAAAPAVAHTDIQARQFLVGFDGTVKINDFNRCRFMGWRDGGDGARCPFYISVNGGDWRAPEEYTPGHPLDEKLDIYSTSLIFWGLMSRRPPYWDIPTEEQVIRFVRKGGRPPLARHWPAGLAGLCRRMWAQDPRARPSAAEVLAELEELLAEHEITQDDASFRFNYGVDYDEVGAPPAELAQPGVNSEHCLPEPWWLAQQAEAALGCHEIHALLKNGTKIGEGYWRDVFTAPHPDHGVVVIKAMKGKHSHDHRNLARHSREAAALQQLRGHPNVVQLLGRCKYDIATEYMPIGLDRVAFDETLFPEIPLINVYSMALDVMRGVQAIHEIRGGPVVHADIQAQQFLLDFRGTVKINDLNRCRFTAHTAGSPGEACPFFVHDHGGAWRSPEEYGARVRGGGGGDPAEDAVPLDHKLDLYSAGLVLWSLITRKKPWAGLPPEEFEKATVAGQRPAPALREPAEYARLVGELLAQDPSRRPEAREAAERLERLFHAEAQRLDEEQQAAGQGKAPPPPPSGDLVAGHGGGGGGGDPAAAAAGAAGAAAAATPRGVLAAQRARARGAAARRPGGGGGGPSSSSAAGLGDGAHQEGQMNPRGGVLAAHR